MPPKAKFTREEIVKTALRITEEAGIDAVTAREIGLRLGTSSRPIFTHFSSMDEVTEEVNICAKRIYDEYVDEGLATYPPFKGYGKQVMRFVQERPNLFKLLYDRGKIDAGYTPLNLDDSHRRQVEEIMIKTFGIDEEAATWAFNNILIYTHGLANLCIASKKKFTVEEIDNHLTVFCKRLITGIKAEGDERYFYINPDIIK